MGEEYKNAPFKGWDIMEMKDEPQEVEEVQTMQSLEVRIKILRNRLRYVELRLKEERLNSDYERNRSEIWASEYFKLAEDLSK